MSQTPARDARASVFGWDYKERALRPSLTYIDRFCQSYIGHCATDDIIRFQFASAFGAPDEVIHHSRLSFVGGPLCALVSRDFREKRDKTVTLSEVDNPTTFAAIRLFLYCRPIPLDKCSLPQILDLARATHRWQLNPLFDAVCRYVAEARLLANPSAVVQAADVAALPGVPEFFSHCFWASAATSFDAFGPKTQDHKPNGGEGCRLALHDSDDEDDDHAATHLQTPPILAKLCPKFPHLWDIALSQGVISRFLIAVKASSTRDLTADLLELVLQYLEPRMDNDDAVVRLIAAIDPGAMHCENLFDREHIETDCSARAIRLLGKSMLSATHLKHEMSFSWEIPPMASGMVKKTFFFGACSDTSKGVSHISLEDGKGLYSTESCVLFNLQALVTGGSPSLFHLQWEVGQSFPLKDKDMDLRVTVVDTSCSCFRAKRLPDPELEKCLYDWRSSEKVGQSERQISVVLPKAAFKTLRERHDFSSSCPVTIWLHVRLR